MRPVIELPVRIHTKLGGEVHDKSETEEAMNNQFC